MEQRPMEGPTKGTEEAALSEGAARRAFLNNCAKYAVAMPPAITLLLAAPKDAMAVSSSACAQLVPASFNPKCTGDPPPPTD